MNQEIKFQSVQGGPFTTSQNRITFRVPADGVYDLSKSWVNLTPEISIEDTDPSTGVGVYSMDLIWADIDDKQPQVPNASIVKNGLLRTSLMGQIENIRRMDQLRNIIDLYNKSTHEKRSTAYNAFSNTVQPTQGQQVGIYSDLNKTGNVKSRINSQTPIRIQLADLFDFCAQAIEIDTTKTGELTFEFELNVARLDTDHEGDDSHWTYVFKNADWSLADATIANTINSAFKVTNLSQSPLFVGQKVKINGTPAGSSPPPAISDVEAVISNIVWNDDGTFSVSFENDWATLGTNATYTDISIGSVAPVSSVSINFGELVLTRLPVMESSFDQIEYSTFSTEEVTLGNPQQNLQRQFQVEGGADACIIIFPYDTAGGSILSKNDDLNSYRLRLDNVDLTDRDVEVNGPLHYDRLNLGMTQMKMRLKNLTAHVPGAWAGNYLISQHTDELKQVAIMTPLEQKPREKYLQVNLASSGASLDALTIFKHIPRVFSY